MLDQDFRYKAVGLVSAALPDLDKGKLCDKHNYQLYTDVALYRTWIEGVVFDTY